MLWSGSSISPSLLDRAREVDGGGDDPSSLALLIACVEVEADVSLRSLLTSMLLEPRELRALHRALSELPDAPASEVLLRAKARSDGPIGADELIVAISLVGSPRVAEALSKRGLTATELAAGVAAWRLAREDSDMPTRRVLAAGILSFSLTFATSLLLVVTVARQGSWLKLLLLIPVWSGYPQEGPTVGFLYTLVLAWIVAPAVGVLHALGALAEIAQADAERLSGWSRTGIHLTLRQQRHVKQRLLNVRSRRLRQLRQGMTMRWREAVGGDATTR